MSDDELGAWMRRVSEDMDACLNATHDTEAGLAELRRRAGVTPRPYAEDGSPTGERDDRKDSDEDL